MDLKMLNASNLLTVSVVHYDWNGLLHLKTRINVLERRCESLVFLNLSAKFI